MCLSLAGRIRSIHGEHAIVDVDGTDRRVSLAMLLLDGTPVRPDDWVLVHTGFAVAVLAPEVGADITSLRAELRAGERPSTEVGSPPTPNDTDEEIRS